MSYQYVVRQAQPEDCGNILGLIEESVEFDGGEDPDRVLKNTEEGR